MSQILQGVFESRSPKLTIGICKDLHGLSKQVSCRGVIDTGFTEFAQISVDLAEELELDRRGSVQYVLGNNEPVYLDCYSAVLLLNGVPKDGVVSATPKQGAVLLGMDFLRIFDRSLVIDNNSGVYVIERDFLSPIVQAWNPVFLG